MVELDPGELQRGGFDIGADEGFHAEEQRVLRIEQALFVHADGYRGDLKQSVRCAVEAATLHVDHHWEEATESVGHG